MSRQLLNVAADGIDVQARDTADRADVHTTRSTFSLDRVGKLVYRLAAEETEYTTAANVPAPLPKITRSAIRDQMSIRAPISTARSAGMRK